MSEQIMKFPSVFVYGIQQMKSLQIHSDTG